MTFQINRQGQPLGLLPAACTPGIEPDCADQYACQFRTPLRPSAQRANYFKICQSDHLYYSRILPSCSGSQAGSLQSVTVVIEGLHSLLPCTFQCIM